MPSTFTAVAPGGISGRRAKVDGQRVFLVEDEAGDPILQIGGGLPLTTPGTVIYSAAGAFLIPTPPQPANRWQLLDARGAEVAAIDKPSRDVRVLQVPGGQLLWRSHRLRPQYRIDEVYGASRTALHAVAQGVARRSFTGDVHPGLVNRLDSSLVLVLAVWLTWRAIETKAADEANRNSG